MRVRPPLSPTAPSARRQRAPMPPARGLCEALTHAAQRGALFDADAVQPQLVALGNLGRPGLAALVQVLGHLRELRRTQAGAAVADHFEAHCQLGAIEALARAARGEPNVLAQAYHAADCPTVRDSLCEAAAKIPGTHQALFALMLEHLGENSFVAGLSLAAHGDPSALPYLQAQLHHELSEPASTREQISQRSLRVDALIEAIQDLGGRLPAELMGQLASAVARGRPALGPLLALLPPGAPFRPA